MLDRCRHTLLNALAALSFICVALQTAGADQTEQLLVDMQDGRLDEFTLLEASLMVGGFSRSECQAVDEHWRRQLRDEAPTASGQRALQLLDRLHREVLTGAYRTNASQPAITLASGDYNCLSAATIFLMAARICDVPAQAVLLPGHTRCRVWVSEQQRWLDIEPSLPDEWVANEQCDGRELTDVELLAKLYYNRGIELLAEREYGAALRCARYGSRFDPAHTAAQDNVAVIVNNWSLALCEEGRFAEALELIHRGRQATPGDKLLTTNELHVYVAWMRHLIKQRDFQGFQSRLHDALSRHPNSSILRAIEGRGRVALF